MLEGKLLGHQELSDSWWVVAIVIVVKELVGERARHLWRIPVR